MSASTLAMAAIRSATIITAPEIVDNSGSLSSSGFLGGGTVGFNYQFPATNYVLGVEGDFDGSTVHTNDDSPFGVDGGSIPNDTKLDWFATARARFGYAFGNILPYVTGGGAFGHVDQLRVDTSADPFGNFSVGSTRTGWTAGAGIEYQVTHNLSVKAEYLHVGSWPAILRDAGRTGLRTSERPFGASDFECRARGRELEV